MKKFLQRLIQTTFGKGYTERLQMIAEILGVPLKTQGGISDDEVERLFIEAVQHRFGCILDWRSKWDDIHAAALEVASDEESELILGMAAAHPDTIYNNIRDLGHSMAVAGLSRRPVLLESLGDFVHLLLIPVAQLSEVEDAAGGWMIEIRAR